MGRVEINRPLEQTAAGEDGAVKGNVFSIERHALHDGGGIRTIVYLKGCPLRCLWCANPEGQEVRSQVFYFADRCVACGRCVAVCPHGASRRDAEGSIEFDLAACQGCGNCVEACYADARRLFGRAMAVEEVLAVVLKDRPFYRQSGGGVTVSGGEPTMQPEFVAALLAECQRRGVNTAVETCGYSSWANLAAIAAHLDLALYDVKHMDSAVHRRLTGVPNEPILDNLRRLAATGVPILVRVPVIPGMNDSPENLAALAAFVADLPAVEGIELLPYHNYGSGKYARCGKEYPLPELEPPSRAHVAALAAIVAARGVKCIVQ